MKKIALFIVVLLLSWSVIHVTSSEASTFREVKQLSSEQVLRVQASPSAKAVTTLPKGTLVTQFQTVAGGWSYVQANQYKGYVATKALIVPKSTIKIASSKSGLVVKETASPKSKTTATLKYNMIVEDFGSVGGGWSFVQYGNVTGYVASSFIGKPKEVTKYVVGTSNNTVRNIASTSGISKGVVKGGTAVTEYAQIAGWSYISAGSVRGYIPTNQLVAKKPAAAQPATLTSFEHLRPSKISWMNYFVHIYDDERVEKSGFLVEEYNSYSGGYSYIPESFSGNTIYPPYMFYSKKNFMWGMPESDVIWADIPASLKQGVPSPIYEIYVGDGDRALIGNYYLRSTTATLKVRAGTFTNVVHIEAKYYDGSPSTHYYFAPGYGIIKELDGTRVMFELYDYTLR